MLFDRVDATIGVISRILAVLAGVCTIAVMVVIATDVLYRNTTGGSFPGAYESVGALMVLIAFLGLGYAARSGSNVRVSLVVDRMPPSLAKYARLFGETVAFVLIVWFAYANWGAALTSRERGEFTQGLVNFTVWPLRMAIAAGFTFLAVEQILIIWRTLLRGKAVPEASVVAVQVPNQVDEPDTSAKADS